MHVNDAVDMAIHNNRIEVQNLLKRSLQPPPVAVTMGSVHIEQTVRLLTFLIKQNYCCFYNLIKYRLVPK